MAFLTKKERLLITVINTNETLTQPQRDKMIDDIRFNANARAAGHKGHVREFIQALASHQVTQAIKKLNNG